MIRFYNNIECPGKIHTYLAAEAGKTILQAIDLYRSYMFQLDVGGSIYESDFNRWQSCCTDRVVGARLDDSIKLDRFFSSMGNSTEEDGSYGVDIVSRALDDMESKINSPEILEFNIFEEYLFYEIVDFLLQIKKDRTLQRPMKKFCEGNPCPFLPDIQRETQVENHLVQEFSFSGSDAKRYAKLMCRMWKMLFDEDKAYNAGLIFFDDDDCTVIFERGFLRGINILKSPLGVHLGYGFRYVVNMFDRDFKINLPLFMFSEKELVNGGQDLIKDIINEKAEEWMDF